jgi:hypothetical protein
VKLTWFGGGTFRFQIGGQIVVLSGDAVPAGIERAEWLGGADLVVSRPADLPVADANWKPRPAERLLDAGESLRPVEAWTLRAGSVLLDADEDRPLLVILGDVPALGRWAGNAVIIVAGNGTGERARQVLDRGPRLIALAGSDPEVEQAFAALRDSLDGTGLVALEPGLAVEA